MIFLLPYILACLLIGFMGARRPFGFFGYFVASLVFTPMVGLLLFAAAGENRAWRRKP